MEVRLTGKVAFGVSFRSPFSSAWKRLRDARNGDEDVETPFFADLVQASPWVYSCGEMTPGWRDSAGPGSELEGDVDVLDLDAPILEAAPQREHAEGRKIESATHAVNAVR